MSASRGCSVGGFVLSALIALAVPTHLMAEGPDPRAVIKAADEAMYPPSFSVSMAMTTEGQGRSPSVMELDVIHKDAKGTFMELLSPARSRGLRFLQAEGSLWMYSPRAGSRSPIRLSPRDSFQGSALSNNDVGDTTWANDYDSSLVGQATLDVPGLGKVEAWIVVGKALRRDVPYGEIRIYSRKEDLLPLKVEYFAKSGLALKTMLLSDFGQAAGRLRPRRMEMTMDDGTGERTVVDLRDLRAREDLPDSMFNQAWLAR